MTINEFFVDLRKLNLPWYVDERGRIRTKLVWSSDSDERPTGWICSTPINVVAGSTGTGFPLYHGKKLGLPVSVIKELSAADDGKEGPMLKRLMRACKL